MRLLKLPAALILLTGVVLPTGGQGVSETIPGPIPATVLRIIDGDTIIVRARIWLGQDLDTQVRFDGVDVPELKGRCPYENRLALKARAFVQTRTAEGKVVLHDIHYGKYAGRVVARVQMPGGGDLLDAFLRAGLGRGYQGRQRESWCQALAP